VPPKKILNNHCFFVILFPGLKIRLNGPKRKEVQNQQIIQSDAVNIRHTQPGKHKNAEVHLDHIFVGHGHKIPTRLINQLHKIRQLRERTEQNNRPIIGKTNPDKTKKIGETTHIAR
jgi:hypothetical protein